MNKNNILAVLLCAALAAPCAAEFKDAGEAVKALKSDKVKDRLEAIYYLGARRDDASYAALAAHFPGESDAYLRSQLVGALSVEESTWAYVCALDAASDRNKAVRQAAASALAPKVGDEEAARKLEALALDQAETVRLSVVNALAVNVSTRSVAILAGTMADRKGPLRARRAAAAALSKMKTPAADGELLKHLSDPDPEVKAAAVSRRPGKAKAGKKK